MNPERQARSKREDLHVVQAQVEQLFRYLKEMKTAQQVQEGGSFTEKQILSEKYERYQKVSHMISQKLLNTRPEVRSLEYEKCPQENHS
jgi:hypothetical protein